MAQEDRIFALAKEILQEQRRSGWRQDPPVIEGDVVACLVFDAGVAAMTSALHPKRVTDPLSKDLPDQALFAATILGSAYLAPGTGFRMDHHGDVVRESRRWIELFSAEAVRRRDAVREAR